jgi:hypothetical protein
MKATEVKGAAPPQYEYKIVSTGHFKEGSTFEEECEQLSKEFNALAADGWEYHSSKGPAYDVFRRVKQK